MMNIGIVTLGKYRLNLRGDEAVVADQVGAPRAVQVGQAAGAAAQGEVTQGSALVVIRLATQEVRRCIVPILMHIMVLVLGGLATLKITSVYWTQMIRDNGRPLSLFGE